MLSLSLSLIDTFLYMHSVVWLYLQTLCITCTCTCTHAMSIVPSPALLSVVQSCCSPAKFLLLKSGTGLVARASICSTCMSLRAEARCNAVLPLRSGKLTEAPAWTNSWTMWGCLVMIARWSGVCGRGTDTTMVIACVRRHHIYSTEKHVFYTKYAAPHILAPTTTLRTNHVHLSHVVGNVEVHVDTDY